MWFIFALYYQHFLDHELTPVCFFHKTLMSHFKLLLVKLYILLTPSCFVFPSHWNAGGHFAFWIQRRRQLWPMELRGFRWGWRGSGEAPGQNYKAPPTIKALFSPRLCCPHTRIHTNPPFVSTQTVQQTQPRLPTLLLEGRLVLDTATESKWPGSVLIALECTNRSYLPRQMRFINDG